MNNRKTSGIRSAIKKLFFPSGSRLKTRFVNIIFLVSIMMVTIAGISCLMAGVSIFNAIPVFVPAGLLLFCMFLINRLINNVEYTRVDLEQQNMLLEAVKETLETLLASESDDPGKSLTKAMGLLACCVDADRMYIWKILTIGDKQCYEKQYEWLSDKVPPGANSPTAAYFSLETIPQWDNLFSAGKHINGTLDSFSRAERDILESFSIRSILAIPLFLQKQNWGFVSFDNCIKERIFSENEVSILRSGSLLMANAIVRDQNRITIEMRIKQRELMSSISRSFLSKEPMNIQIGKALGQIGEFMKTNRIAVVTPDKDTNESRLVYSWFSSEEWRPEPIEKGFCEIFCASFPQFIPETGYITAICCNDIESEYQGKYKILGNAGIKSFIWAPVYVEGAFWGLVSVEECANIRIWNENDVQLLGAVSGSIAGAVARDIIDKARAEALEQAVQASRAKGNFLANMSHEMRTPLNAIFGMTSIGRDAKDIQKKDYAFEKIENASSHLLGVINDILDMSKIEANKFELSIIIFDFEKMLQRVVNVINFRIDERRQEFTVQIDEKIPNFVIGDDQHLAQVITNLLSNAVKFTPEKGNIRLNAKLMEMENDLCTIKIEVTDSGIGISEEHQLKLFNSFEQADSGTTRKFGGTGLGLAISKRIVELMGGRIWIESEPEKGSTFAFTVKLKKGHGIRAEMLAPGINVRNIRILTVDDNPEVLEYFSELMMRINIKCDTAAGGKEALLLIEKKGHYDICFIDWKMPEMDGIELTRRIKERITGKSVVIMISAAEWNQVETEAREAGVDKFLSKPLFPSAIVDIINECLGSNNLEKAREINVSETMDSFEGYTILLAEDVEINREIVITLLEPTAIKIETAENGMEALEKFTAAPEKYSMIFMDVQMPEMDGLDATRKIRALENERRSAPKMAGKVSRDIPIVAMSANVFREDIEKCLMAGMNDHVGKPLDFNEVFEKLRKYCLHESSERSHS